MILSKAQILSETNSGLGIYSYILRQFYPREVVLRMKGKVSIPTKNPYNYDHPTLKISVVDGVAKHTDSEGSIPDGDVFLFASRFYSLHGTDLLWKIAEDLNLKFKRPDLNKTTIREPRVESPTFSYFSRPITNTQPQRTVSLYEIYHLIRGSALARSTARLRLITDATAFNKFKRSQFSYVTFSGRFSARSNNALISYSGLMTIDFDKIENPGELREKLLNDEYFETELLFISPSGKGLKWIIPYYAGKVNHTFYFMAVANYLKKTYRLRIDQSGKDISRACFLCHDPNCYINPKYL